MNHRNDQQTAASLLGAFLEVVNLPGIKGMHDLIPDVHRWEAKVAALKRRYQEDLKDTLKQAIFIGMLPKEFQELVLQNGNMIKEGETISFEAVRDYVFNVANQRMQMVRPVPMDVGCAEDHTVGSGGLRKCVARVRGGDVNSAEDRTWMR